MSYRESLFYAHFAGAISANTVIKGPLAGFTVNPGVLHSVTINTTGATVGAVTLNDGVGGPVIAVITPVASTNPINIIYDIRFNNALIISGSGATMDVTVSYE